MFNSEQRSRAINLFMRLSSLGFKLILTLYMGRFFELSSLGAYGLVFSSVVIVNTLMGQELGYIVKREIVGIAPQEALHKIRDQVVWYGVNYGLLALAVVGLIVTGVTEIPTKYLIYILVLGVSESLGTLCYNNMNLFNQQVLANVALFVRAALWIPVVLVLGFVGDEYRTEDTVLISWAVSSFLALGVPLWAWRHWGWAEVLKKPIDVAWLVGGVKKSMFIWLGTFGLMICNYIDRYFVIHFIDLEHVGVMTFYYSFVNALVPLVESGALVFTAPKLVEMHKKKNSPAFWREVVKVCWQVGLGVAVLALLLSGFVPLLIGFLGKAAFIEEIGTFWLLLVSTWIGSFSLIAYYVLFAQHRDKPIWAGNILLLIPISICNLIFIPQFGFTGIGYSAIVTALILLAWRAYFIQWPKKD